MSGMTRLILAAAAGVVALTGAAPARGPWSAPVTVGSTPQPDTDGGIAAHPELGAPPGQVMVSWLVNIPGYYDPKFADVGL